MSTNARMNAKPLIRIVSENANPATCSACGGACCKRMPGELLPGDLSPTLDETEIIVQAHSLLESGLFAIDWWINFRDGEPGFYMRPATVGREGEWKDPSWGGRCVIHHDDGCELSAQDRPSGCKALIPKSGSHGCTTDGTGYISKLSAAEAWWPYRDALQNLCVEYGPEESHLTVESPDPLSSILGMLGLPR